MQHAFIVNIRFFQIMLLATPHKALQYCLGSAYDGQLDRVAERKGTPKLTACTEQWVLEMQVHIPTQNNFHNIKKAFASYTKPKVS